MRILLTNVTLASRTGTELFVRDLALGLQAAGHRPAVYTPDPGRLAEELRAAGVAVSDDLAALDPPDLIHGHHAVPTMTAIASFPGVPAIFVLHDRSQWTDEPPRHPRIARWVAVDLACRERLVSAPGIAPEKIRVIHNAFDPARFRPRAPLPPAPRRALLFSNYATEATIGGALREACAAAGMTLDVVGAAGGNPSDRPEEWLGGYDLVFAKARCAIEAMAVGCAVVLCDLGGLGGLVTPDAFDRLRSLNFGGRTLTRDISAASVLAEIGRYDVAVCTEVSRRIRLEGTVARQVEAFVALYREVLAEPPARVEPAAEAAAMAEFLGTLMPRWSELWRYSPQGLEASIAERRAAGETSTEPVALDREIRALRLENAALAAGRRELEQRLASTEARFALRTANRLSRLPGLATAWRRWRRPRERRWRAMPIVVGAPRSGTTLLRLMLDSHSRLAIPPETGWLAGVAGITEGDGAGRAALYAAIVDCPSWPDFHFSRQALAAALDAVQPFTVADGVRAFYRLYAARQGKPRWGEKTPGYGSHMPEIARLLPEARFVHLVRDGRDVALSLRGLWFSPGDTPEELAADWVARVRAARAAAAHLGTCLEVRFEALIREPERELRRVCAHCDLRFEPAMLDYHRRAASRLAEHEGRVDAAGRESVRREERLANQRRVTEPPDRSRIGVWRREMTAEDRRRFESVAGPLLAELGYGI